jgi:hypothetical protein
LRSILKLPGGRFRGDAAQCRTLKPAQSESADAECRGAGLQSAYRQAQQRFNQQQQLGMQGQQFNVQAACKQR